MISRQPLIDIWLFLHEKCFATFYCAASVFLLFQFLCTCKKQKQTESMRIKLFEKAETSFLSLTIRDFSHVTVYAPQKALMHLPHSSTDTYSAQVGALYTQRLFLRLWRSLFTPPSDVNHSQASSSLSPTGSKSFKFLLVEDTRCYQIRETSVQTDSQMSFFSVGYEAVRSVLCLVTFEDHDVKSWLS